MKKIDTAQAIFEAYMRTDDRQGEPREMAPALRMSEKERRAERTTDAARGRIEAETAERLAKTRRLAEARRRKQASQGG